MPSSVPTPIISSYSLLCCVLCASSFCQASASPTSDNDDHYRLAGQQHGFLQIESLPVVVWPAPVRLSQAFLLPYVVDGQAGTHLLPAIPAVVAWNDCARGTKAVASLHYTTHLRYAIRPRDNTGASHPSIFNLYPYMVHYIFIS